MKRRLAGLFCTSLLCLGSGAAFGGDPASDNTVPTIFTVLVGFPSEEQQAAGGILLVPGTVIPLSGEGAEPGEASRKEVIDKSLSFTKAVARLWNTFRLDPARQLQQSLTTAASVGEPVNLPGLEGANVKITATLTDFNDANANFRIVFRQGEKTLVDSRISVNRGGRAVAGGMDGPAAPYIFLFVEPAPPGGKVSVTASDSKDKGITAPVLIRKDPPRYPEEAKQKRIMGVVVLEVIIGSDGKVDDVQALENPDPHLTEAAIDAIRQWIYLPAHDAKGQPVKVKATVTVNFALK